MFLASGASDLGKEVIAAAITAIDEIITAGDQNDLESMKKLVRKAWEVEPRVPSMIYVAERERQNDADRGIVYTYPSLYISRGF